MGMCTSYHRNGNCSVACLFVSPFHIAILTAHLLLAPLTGEPVQSLLFVYFGLGIMAQSYIEMARLATSPHTESHQNTIRDFVLQHNTLLFAPGGMCSRVLELEHQLLALSVRIAALENAQPAERREPDERFRPDVEGQASTPVLSFPFSVTEAFEPAFQETTPHNSKELVRPLKRKRNRSSAPGPKHRLPAFPVIQVTFDENAQSR